MESFPPAGASEPEPVDFPKNKTIDPPAADLDAVCAAIGSIVAAIEMRPDGRVWCFYDGLRSRLFQHHPTWTAAVVDPAFHRLCQAGKLTPVLLWDLETPITDHSSYLIPREENFSEPCLESAGPGCKIVRKLAFWTAAVLAAGGCGVERYILRLIFERDALRDARQDGRHDPKHAVELENYRSQGGWRPVGKLGDLCERFRKGPRLADVGFQNATVEVTVAGLTALLQADLDRLREAHTALLDQAWEVALGDARDFFIDGHCSAINAVLGKLPALEAVLQRTPQPAVAGGPTSPPADTKEGAAPPESGRVALPSKLVAAALATPDRFRWNGKEVSGISKMQMKLLKLIVCAPEQKARANDIEMAIWTSPGAGENLKNLMYQLNQKVCSIGCMVRRKNGFVYIEPL